VGCALLELLKYFENADYVVTDIFHGTVFSIKYNKNFVTIVRNTNAHKLEYLLDKFKLTNRIVKTPADIKCKLEKAIDYADSNFILDEAIKKEMTYLKKAVSL
jgi:hypothetical protein